MANEWLVLEFNEGFGKVIDTLDKQTRKRIKLELAVRINNAKVSPATNYTQQSWGGHKSIVTDPNDNDGAVVGRTMIIKYSQE